MDAPGSKDAQEGEGEGEWTVVTRARRRRGRPLPPPVSPPPTAHVPLPPGTQEEDAPAAPLSYGVIAYHGAREGERLYLLYQRRDTFGYISLLKGTWTAKHLPFLVEALTDEERQRLTNHVFDELWDDLWVDHGCFHYGGGLQKGRQAFHHLCNNPRFNALLVKHDAEAGGGEEDPSDAPWGFPKGRRHAGEDAQACALRETKEETQLPPSLFVVEATPLPPLTEDIHGFDDRVYRAEYFVARASAPLLPRPVPTPQCGIRASTVSEESQAVEWVPFDEAMRRLCPQKRALLRRVHAYLTAREEATCPSSPSCGL